MNIIAALCAASLLLGACSVDAQSHQTPRPRMMHSSAAIPAQVRFAPQSVMAMDDVTVEYTVDLSDPQTQTVNVTMRITELNADAATIDVMFPTWRPGRYEILELAGAIRSVDVTDERGRKLKARKLRKAMWRVELDGARELNVRYTIYANELGTRTRHVDDTHAFLSGTSVFMYTDEHRNSPCIVRIVNAPQDWRVSCGLKPVDAGSPNVLYAANYDVLVDSPIEVGLHELIEFDVDGLQYQIMLWGEYETVNRRQLIDDFSKIVRACLEMFSAAPYERYVFLTHVGMGAGGGTEHINSTIMQTSTSAIEGSDGGNRTYKRFLGLVSHEFFHTWNVKSFRPAGIVPYDYQNENYSTQFWVAEGTTSYYDDLLLARTGLMTIKQYFDAIASNFGSISERPGAAVQSLADSSFDAWIKFNKASPDSVNSTVSFYSKGALVSLMLDMEIRRMSGNTNSLDDVMRTLYEQYRWTDNRGYTPDDLQRLCEQAAGGDLDAFFDAYVRGTAPLNLADALATAGLEMTFEYARDDDDEADDAQENDGQDEDADATTRAKHKPYLGLSAAGNTVRSIRSDSPAYRAGFMAGDELVAINGERLGSGQLNSTLNNFEAGATIAITFFRRDELRTWEVTLDAKADGKWVINHADEPTDLQRAVYETWMKQDWPGKRETERDAGADTSDGDG